MFFGTSPEENFNYNESEQLANRLTFEKFCKNLDELENNPRKYDKPKKKIDYIFSVSLKKELKNASVFPLLRLLIPESDLRYVNNPFLFLMKGIH